VNNTAKLQAIDALYATLPTLECQQKCQACCCTFGMSRLELRRIEQRVGPLEVTQHRVLDDVHGKELGVHQTLKCAVCPMLKEGLCSIYDIRPAICRLWGLTERMACPHGCKPSRVLSPEEVFNFMSAVLKLGY